MKNLFLLSMIAVLTVGLIAQPATTYAKSENSGPGNSRDRDRDDDHWEWEDDEDDDDSRSRNRSFDDNTANTLEAEADVFTDTTIVKVELPGGGKVVFETDADTRDEVLDEIVDRLDLDRDEVDAVLNFEIEDRASRANDRRGLNSTTNPSTDNRPGTCVVDTDALEVEVDVFTDTTIVKVEHDGTITVFETDATTSAAVVDEVVDRFGVTTEEVEAVLDFEVEDRASRTDDFAVSRDDLTCEDSSNPSTSASDTAIRAQITALQRLIEKLTELLNLRLGLLN